MKEKKLLTKGPAKLLKISNIKHVNGEDVVIYKNDQPLVYIGEDYGLEEVNRGISAMAYSVEKGDAFYVSGNISNISVTFDTEYGVIDIDIKE